MATKTIVMNRDAKTGQLVKPAYVKSHPATTTVERRTVTTSKPSGSKKSK